MIIMVHNGKAWILTTLMIIMVHNGKALFLTTPMIIMVHNGKAFIPHNTNDYNGT